MKEKDIFKSKIYTSLMDGKIIIAADRNSYAFIPQNAFFYDKETNTLSVFTMKNCSMTSLFAKELQLNREMHFTTNEYQNKKLMLEYIEKFIMRAYGFTYEAREGEIVAINIPDEPIMHIEMEEARSWLYKRI